MDWRDKLNRTPKKNDGTKHVKSMVSGEDFPTIVEMVHSLQDSATGRNLRKAAGSHILSLLAQPGARGIATEKEAQPGFRKCGLRLENHGTSMNIQHKRIENG